MLTYIKIITKVIFKTIELKKNIVPPKIKMVRIKKKLK